MKVQSLFRRLRSLSLRTAVIVYILFPIVLLMAACGSIALHSVETRVSDRLQEDIQLIARAIQLPVSNALAEHDSAGVRQALSSAFRIGRVYGAYVYDASGKRIASAGIARRGIDVSQAAVLAAGKDRKGEFGKTSEQKVYSYFIPLVGSGNRIIGLLQVTRRASDFSTYMNRIRWAGLGLLVSVTLCLIAVVTWGYYRAIGRHLSSFVHSMARIGEGDRELRVSVKGPKELVTLGTGINRMLDGIMRSQTALAQHQAEQRKLEVRLAESEKMAAIGRLAAGVAHELGSPLSVVDGKAQRLLRRSDRLRAETKALQDIRSAVGRMEDIVRKLMDLDRNSGERRRWCRVERLAWAALARLQPEFDAEQVTMDIRDEQATSQTVMVNAHRIEQALANVLRNALQATPGGHVRFAWDVNETEVVFRIEDDGPGIADGIQSRLFEPFFTTKPVGQGTGLGLALAHATIRDHGGRVEIARAALGGAMVSLILPVREEENSGSGYG